MVKKRKVSGIFDKDLWVKREGGGRGGVKRSDLGIWCNSKFLSIR